jgi:alpha-L-fucosidase
MKWFKEAKFGIFIHFGLYSQLAGEYKGKPGAVMPNGYRQILIFPVMNMQNLLKHGILKI